VQVELAQFQNAEKVQRSVAQLPWTKHLPKNLEKLLPSIEDIERKLEKK